MPLSANGLLQRSSFTSYITLHVISFLLADRAYRFIVCKNLYGIKKLVGNLSYKTL